MAKSVRHAVPPAPPVSTAANDMTPKALTKQEFGRRLYQLMMQRNMSQADLARAARLGRDSISTYIRGLCFPEPKSLKKLADVFGVEPYQLLPNSIESAIDNEMPALEIKQAAGHPDKVWLRVNQLVDLRTAAKVFDALKPREVEPSTK